MSNRRDMILLFDVDGTLTSSRKVITQEMLDFMLNKVIPVSCVGLVGGSDIEKISEQMGGMDVINKFDFVFSENGLVAMKDGQQIACESIRTYMKEEVMQSFINFCLQYMSQLTLPCKRGTFIEYRNGLINVCPVGRSCSQAERDEFEQYDNIHNVRKKFISALEEKFPDIGLKYSIGGQISFDVFPIGWDKTFCLKFLTDFKCIHFFGDKTDPGGNDYEIFTDSRTTGYKVTGPDNTKDQLIGLLKISS